MNKFLHTFNVPTLSSLLKKKKVKKPQNPHKMGGGERGTVYSQQCTTIGHNSVRQNPSAPSYSHIKQFLPFPFIQFLIDFFSNLDLLPGFTSYLIYCNMLIVCLCLTLLSLGLLFLSFCASSPKILCHFFEILMCFVFMHK